VKKILITGASGSLGRNIAKKLYDEGNDICALVRTSSRLDKDYKKIVINDTDDYKNEIKNFAPEIIIHAACLYGVNAETQAEMMFTNYLLGLTLISSIENQKFKSVFINIGTSLECNINQYSYLKNKFVKDAKSYIEDKQSIKFINLITHNVYGADFTKNNIINQVVYKCLKNEDIELTSGLQKKDFIYIEDFISAVFIVIKNVNKFKNIQDIDIGTGYQISIKELAQLIKEKSESQSKLNLGIIQKNFLEKDQIANIETLKILGFKVEYDLDKGLEKVIERSRIEKRNNFFSK
jgi:CDP-paratose synthetase